jgi:hypothetical protein
VLQLHARDVVVRLVFVERETVASIVVALARLGVELVLLHVEVDLVEVVHAVLSLTMPKA